MHSGRRQAQALRFGRSEALAQGTSVSIWIDKDGRRHVGIMHGGKRIHRKLPEGATASDAKQLEAELRAAIVRQRKPVIPGDPELTAIMGVYLEHAKSLRSPETAAFHAARLGPWVERYRASDAQQCAAHMLRDMKGHYAAATINRSLGALKKALSIAWERGLTPENYGLRIKRLPENNQREVVLTIQQVQTLTEHASEQVRAAIWIALYTGCRRGEILKMREADIGPDSILIRAGNTKTLKTRLVPIAGPLRRWLGYIPLAITFEGLKTGFRRAREAAGMPHVTYHDLRRSCGSLMIQAGVDLYVVSKILGHSSVAVTQSRYAYMQTEQMKAGLDRAFGADDCTDDCTGKEKRPRRAA
jgi:integrase